MMTITYEDLQRCRKRHADLYRFEGMLKAFDPANMPGEIFFDEDAIRQRLRSANIGRANLHDNI